ncbi:MAG: tetratricopeptide repeat protein [Candidatus Gastranaerophilales bacterium]|nr:tetratricopeptide repeat protein [Candidatus Gastranaerophilales bacterium]
MDDRLSSVNGNVDTVKFKMNIIKTYIEKQEYEKAKTELINVLELEPENVEANYWLGQIYQFEEKYSDAAELFAKVMQNNPNDEFKLRAAEVFELADRDREAIDIYEEFYNKNNKDADIIGKIAHLARVIDDNRKAVEFYNKLLEIDNNDILALNELIDLYQHTNRYAYYQHKSTLNKIEGRPSQAIGCLKKALLETEDENQQIETRKELAKLYLQQQNYLLAIDEFLKILEKSEDIEIYKNLAEAYMSVDSPTSAMEVYENILKITPDEKDSMRELAEIYIDFEENKKALVLLEKLEKLDFSNPQNAVNIVKVLITLQKDDEAFEKINQVLTKDNKNVEALSVLADFYLIKNESEKALQTAQKIQTIIPNSPFGYKKLAEVNEKLNNSFDTHYNYGIYHDLKGEKQLAIDEFTWALEQNDENINVLLKLAKLYEEVGEEYVAGEYYEKIYGIDNSNISALKKMSDIFIEKEDYSRAMDVCDAILKINENDIDARLNLAIIQEAQKDYENALINYNLYLEKAPLTPQISEIRKKTELLNKKINGEDNEGLLNKVFKIFFK